MTSQYRHRRTSLPATAFPTLEPGEIATNTANRQIAVGDAASGTLGAPLNLIAIRYFDSRAIYAAGDMVCQAGVIYRAKAAAGPSSFTPAQWDMLVGATDPQYVAKAGDVMTGMLTLPATAPSSGNHATNKTYVDTGLAASSADTALRVLKAGDVMTGMLTLPATTPSAAQHATHKAYVDGLVAAKSSVITSDTPPVGAVDNTLWYEGDTGLLFIKFNDGTSTQWCAIAAQAGDAVRYDNAQGLTANQTAQARANIAVTKRNYVVNGGMQVSQENGATAGTVSSYYPVDQFFWGSGTSATYTVAQVAVATPGGSPNRVRVAVSVADASVAAGDVVYLVQRLEGLRVADLAFGAATAKTITIQFGVKAPAGTYCVTIANITVATRSYVAEYTIAAGETNTDVVKSVTVPGDITGSWAKDSTIGLEIRFSLMTGTTYQQAAGSWGTVNAYGSANQFNFMGQTASPFELFDVSLTEGTVAPPFQLPDYASELALCQRYWQRLLSYLLSGYTNAGGAVYATIPISPTMRATPAVTFANIAYSNMSGLAYPQAFPNLIRLSAVITATGFGYTQADLPLNARL